MRAFRGAARRCRQVAHLLAPAELPQPRRSFEDIDGPRCRSGAAAVRDAVLTTQQTRIFRHRRSSRVWSLEAAGSAR